MSNEASTAENNQSDTRKWPDRVLNVAILLSILTVMILVYLFKDIRSLILLGGIVFAGVGIFPLTYLAYLSFRAPAQRDRLKDDFRLLGLAGTDELDSVVEKLYNTAYNTTHFAVFISLIIVFCLLMGTAFLHQSHNVLLDDLPSLRFADMIRGAPDSISPPQGESSPTAAAGSTTLMQTATITSTGAATVGGPQGESSTTVPAGSTTPTQTATITSTGAATIDGNGTAIVEKGPEPPPVPTAPDAQPMLVFFAFLGAYLFGIQELVRRYNTFDLLPQVYSSIFVRLILATGVVYVGAQFITSLLGPEANGATLAMVIAFLIGIFPQRGIDWLAEKTKDVFDTKMSITSVRPLTEIIGISPWHQARLEEMGIDDAQNLAMVDIRKLLLTTQFDTQEIVNWIDQAILYVKVGTKITTLRENYINTFYELNAKLDAHKRDPVAKPSPVMSNLGITDDAILAQIADATNYPNYTHILEYYLRSSLIVQQRAEEGTEVITGGRLPYLATDIQDIDGGVANTDEKKVILSIEQLRKLAGESPADAKLWMALGVQKQLLRRHRQAMLLQMVDTADEAAKTQKKKAEQEIATLENEAKTAFNKAIEFAPEVAESYVRRAAFCLEHLTQANGDEVGDATQKASQEIDKAIQDCTLALARDPALAYAYHYRALAHIKQNNNQLALADFNRALRANDRLAVAYMNRGLLRTGQAEFETAVEDYAAAYYCGFRKPMLFANWGKALCGLKKYESAIEKLSHAIAMDPDQAQPFADRGYAYYQSALYQIVEMDPDKAQPFTDRGYTYFQSALYQNAEADFQRAIEKDNDKQGKATAHINLGLVKVAQGRHDRAKEDYVTAECLLKEISQDVPEPLWYALYLNRGRSHLALGDGQAAKKDLTSALEKAATEHEKNAVRISLALALAKKEDTTNAKKHLGDFLKSDDPGIATEERKQAQEFLNKLG
jgi:tetratricopeptide (TPR) repeat protein